MNLKTISSWATIINYILFLVKIVTEAEIISNMSKKDKTRGRDLVG